MDETNRSESVNIDSCSSSHKQWSSRINVCPGSTPTLVTSAIFLENQYDEEGEEEEKESKSTASLSSTELKNFIDWGSGSTWPDLAELPGTWGTYALEEHPWNDTNKPCVRFRAYRDLKLNEIENKGVLTDRIIAACSSYLDRSPESGKYVFCKVDLSKKLLYNINILTYHHYLQYVDLSWNELSDVQVLGQLPFLMYLDVSHNFLTETLHFKAPFNLTFVNYSNNSLRYIGDLSKFWSLVHLDLSHNRIKTIEGLQELKFLRHLNLSYNAIECIEHLNHMKLLTLNLQRNNISRFEEGDDVGFKTLIDVLRINVAFNRLTTLKLFEGIPGIQAINAMGNSIDNLMEITYLQDLNFLTEVDFRDNPIVNMKHYACVCLSNIKYLYMLDGEIMNAERKVLAKHTFEPSPCAEAISTSSQIIFLQQINDPVLGQPIISADHSPPPIMVLVGPPGSGKAKLLQRFCKTNKRFTILGVSHTTRAKTNEEVANESYHFIDTSQFRNMVLKGEFLTVSQTLGQLFGLAQTELAKTVGKCAVLILHMDLAGALTLRAKGFRCHLVLAMTSTTEVHRKQLLAKYYNKQEHSTYLGAVEVENNPTKAKQFLSEHRPRPSITSVANDIINQLLHSAIHNDDADSKSSVQSFRGDELSFESERIWMSSSRTSGILKSHSRQKGIDSQQPRVSVTFQEIDKPLVTCNSPSQVRVQPSRSVTFCNIPQSDHSLEETKFSVSGTLIRTHEDHGLLSVLSRAQIDERRGSAEENQKIWNLQTKALKLVVDEILIARATYLNTHHTNPGLFTEVIFTDKPEDALNKLKGLLKQCIMHQGNARPYFEFQKDSVYKVMVGSRLKSLHTDIKSQLSITQKQTTSARQQTSKPLESTLNSSPTNTVEKMSQKHKEAITYELPREINYIRKQPRCESVMNAQDIYDNE